MIESKLKFNVNTGDFECAGSEKFIQTSRNEFHQLILDIAKAGTEVPNHVDSVHRPTVTAHHAAKSSVGVAHVPAEYKDIFKLEGDSEISIQTLPTDSEGDYAKLADAALILLWAFDKFLATPLVTSPTFAKCLRKSGAGDVANFGRSVSILQSDHLIRKF